MAEIERLAEQQILQDREIRRLKLWLSDLAVRAGLRADRIIGIIDPDNLPSSSAGGLLVYIGFGDVPSAGLAHSSGNATAYTMDLIVKT